MTRVGLLILCALAACSSEAGGTGVGQKDPDLHCRTWCDATTGCDTVFTDPSSCWSFCRSELAWPCGGHVAAYENCMMDLECADSSNDCEVHLEAVVECRAAQDAACSSCPQGTACYNDGCGVACDLTGECIYTQTEGSCRHQFDSGYCTDFAGCVENDGDCPPEARP